MYIIILLLQMRLFHLFKLWFLLRAWSCGIRDFDRCSLANYIYIEKLFETK